VQCTVCVPLTAPAVHSAFMSRDDGGGGGGGQRSQSFCLEILRSVQKNLELKSDYKLKSRGGS
jgi:hypothetical protein